MTDDRAGERVAPRLGTLMTDEANLVRALRNAVAVEAALPAGSVDGELLSQLSAVVDDLGEPLPAELAELAPHQPDEAGEAGLEAGDSDRPAAAVRSAVIAAARAGESAAALFTTGRLMFVPAACDFAAARIERYSTATNALNASLPQVVAWELRQEGLECHCLCPACSLGACLCVSASMHALDMARGGPGLAQPDERGVRLRSPARADSQLAAAGVLQGDWITAVDDEPVRSRSELQAAIRRHSIGGRLRLRVERNGEAREVAVRHVSDGL